MAFLTILAPRREARVLAGLRWRESAANERDRMKRRDLRVPARGPVVVRFSFARSVCCGSVRCRRQLHWG